MNIVLTGFSGSGKTTVAQELGNITGRGFIDTDVLIEKRLSLKIEDIFVYYGQRFFRYIERNVIWELLHEDNRIISVGGGAFIDSMNISNLKQIGCVVFLNASMDTILGKGIPSHRPLLKRESEESILRLYKSRLPFYKQADLEIIVDDMTPYQIAKAILCNINKTGQ